MPLLVPELLGAATVPAGLKAPRLHVVLATVPELLTGRRVLRPALAALRVVAARRAVWAIEQGDLGVIFGFLSCPVALSI